MRRTRPLPASGGYGQAAARQRLSGVWSHNIGCRWDLSLSNHPTRRLPRTYASHPLCRESARRTELITQMYVAGEALNQSDGLYASIHDGRQRAAVTVALTTADGIEPGALAGVFDLVLPT